MRVSSVQNCSAFGKLYINTNELIGITKSSLKSCEGKLSKTKHIDVVIDSKGIAIKKKMTDILQRVQSFSLYPQENAVGITVLEDSVKKTYKMYYETVDEAKKNWENLFDKTNLNKLEALTKIALWLEKYFELK